ncbi:unnamed protein product [Cuscuta campestris]|uniref:NB-ARC domain-containing protein n=1 Tax=Cuscuta campestris TaxID=132261 RepID=A0A484LT40_9ASTE|nr:unnamed protein product [Cuscuta campestris]
MADGLLFNIVTGILSKLNSMALAEMADAWHFKDQLNMLTETVTTVKSVLLDAQERQEESQTIRDWLRRLQSVVYKAHELFEKISALISKKEEINKGQVFFSSSNQIVCAFSISHKIKRIRSELDGIVRDGNLFSFVLRGCEERGVHYMKRDRGQSHSFVDANDVIGRDNDKNAMLERLLVEDDHATVVAIVGMGGLGKTTLAQVLFNDDAVEKNFDLRLWVCVSEDFDVHMICRLILMSATKRESPNLDMDQVHSHLRRKISGKKYLLVLDDVWSEDRAKWLKLHRLLKCGKSGSKIMVTTRSKRVSKALGAFDSYELQGLSHEFSCDLFKRMTFEPGVEDINGRLVDLGKEIVNKCGNIPLTIIVIGSLLYGGDERVWLSICGSFAKVLIENDVMPILKISYNVLTSPLKTCVAYCAFFPKDYEFSKEELISLWMAEGFLNAPDGSGGRLEEVGPETKVALSEDMRIEKGIRRLSLGYVLNSTQDVPSRLWDLKFLRQRLPSARLSDLRNLNGLRGRLDIFLIGEIKDLTFEANEADLSSKHALNELQIEWMLPESQNEGRNIRRSAIENAKCILEGLKPHSNLKSLTITNYFGGKLPSWASTGNSLLVEIRLINVGRCQLPSFSNLPALKRLAVQMSSVKFMEHQEDPSTTTFFPSLQRLELIEMRNLEGWMNVQPNPHSKVSFVSLLHLDITDCPKLSFFSACPNVKHLFLRGMGEANYGFVKAISLREKAYLGIDNSLCLMSFPKETFLHKLSCIEVLGDYKLTSTQNIREILTANNLPSLQHLRFIYCKNLQSAASGLEKLAVEALTFNFCLNLDFSENGMQWKALNIKPLRTLQLLGLPKTESLPSGMRFLTNLHTLHLALGNLKNLPEWIGCLSSLQCLELEFCCKLT